MPKITVHGGPSLTQEEVEVECLGNSSSTSSEKPKVTSETSEPESPQPAQMMANRYRRARMESSTVRSMDGAGKAQSR